MKMIPDSCSDTTSSAAERRVFRLLAQTKIDADADAVCFHSLNLSRHDYKVVGELDFVLISRNFVIVLEVKGGGVACDEDRWTFTDRYGIAHRKSEGPFQQARSGLFSLRSRIEQKVGHGPTRGLTIGYAVVFPDIDFAQESVEWEAPMVLDAACFRKVADLNTPIEGLVAYWSAKSNKPSPLTNAQVLEVQSLLRPSFERFPSLRNRADDLDSAMEQLTVQQYQQLDFIAENPRILCSGGAGTGKTFLAVELARREASAGCSVAFLTSTPLQRRFVSERLGDAQVTVASLDNLPTGGSYDVLFVDEGQDLVNLDDLAQMDKILAGGLERGRWRVFLDSNKQSGLVGRFDPEALELLKGCGASLGRLTHNCRNTHEIVLQTKLLTGADLGEPSAGHGPPVTIVYYETATGHQTELLDAELDRLHLEGVRPEDITILSRRSLAESCAAACRPARRRRLTDLTSADNRIQRVTHTSFCTIPEFKGLESQFILVVDIDTLDASEYDTNALYVAMSRARTGLWLSMDQALRSRAEDISREHLPQVMEDARRARN